jgi:uncharacterized membrane protein YciS (DUF1049 family)
VITAKRGNRILFFSSFLVLLSFLWLTSAARPQMIRGQYYNPNDERFKFLALKKCEQYLKEAKSRYERARMLSEKNLISAQEFERIEGDYLVAQVEYQQALLSVIFEKPHIVIEGAIKYQTKDGQRRVKLTLRNSAGGAFDMYKLEGTQNDTLGYDLRPSELTNIYVSLKEGETIISHPYETKIPVLKFGETKTIDFLLLKDLDTPVVAINYADKVEEKKILLQKGSSADVIGISSVQFSQEADFGSKVTYDLTLERFGGENKTFKLEVLNLPRQIAYDFMDPKTGARLSQLKFTEGATTRMLSLVLYLPDREDSTIAIDQPIEFFAITLDPRSSPKSESSAKRPFTESEIEQLSAGKVELELIPRGRPKIDVMAKELYHEIKTGQEVHSEVIIRNSGTRRVDNLTVRVDLPYNWRAEIAPEVIRSLEQDEEQRVELTFVPTQDVGVGDYEIKIRTQSVVDNRKVESENKVIRIHVASQTRLIGSLLLILLLTGLVIGIVVFGIRLSRR